MNESALANLAVSALRQYAIAPAQITRMNSVDNTTFRVVADDASFVLRLHTAGRHDQAAITSELAWLHSLHTDTALIVPAPVANLHGQFITSVADGDTAATLCTLMTWIEGQPVDGTMNHEQIANAGATMAQLHLHAQQWTPPPHFTRPTYDATYFRTCLQTLQAVVGGVEEIADDLKVLSTHARAFIDQIAQLQQTPDTFGLTHADFHAGNYLLDGEQVRIIDFDRCGFGFFLSDLSLPLMDMNDAQRRSFVQGYERIKPLPQGYADFNQIFLCLAYLDNLATLAPHPAERAYVIQEAAFVSDAFRRARGDQ